MFKLCITLTLLLSFLTGCASMDESECLVADWYTVGYEDGSAGKVESNIREYRKDCAEYKVVPNLSAYRTGHYAGSKQFCRERNGYLLGKTGYEYKGNCHHDLEDGFLAGYQDGQQVYALKKIVDSYQSQMARSEKEILNMSELIADKNELIIADGLIREQRLAIRDELITLQENAIQLEQIFSVIKERFLAADKNYKSTLQRYDRIKR